MSGKFLARTSVLALAFTLAACGGDDGSSPIVNVGSSDSGSSSSNNEGGSTQREVSLELGTGAADNFQSGAIDLSATNLSSGGIARIEFNVVDANADNSIYNAQETTVTLTSECESAKLDTPLVTTSGKISTSYEAGCSGTDTITARLSNGSTATAVVSVASQEVGALEFVSASPTAIATLGSSDSARASVSTIIFRLVDKNGDPIVGQPVDYTISTTVGGISLTETSSDTIADGTAQTRINAGTVATVVSVTATFDVDNGEVIQTTSDPVSVSATIPDQDSFSISVAENFLPNARRYDGETVQINIRAADRNNNPINDTIVNFVTSGGAVPNECTLTEGACVVGWVSQDPKTPDNGIIAILARTVGEESFRDLNSDGIYTAGTDLFIANEHDSSEAFLDRNRNNSRDPDEEFFDYNTNNAFDVADGIYNGTACSPESEDANDCTTAVKEIFELTYLYATSDIIGIDPPAIISAPGNLCFDISGDFFDSTSSLVQGPPPGNTSVEFSTTNGRIIGESSFNTTTSFRTTPVTLCIATESDGTSDSGTLTVTVTPPAPYSGSPYVQNYSITD
ncbi:hypothetical protein [Marinobacter apostichopi]|uniref:hypothetical protein n=1 Tax=Marinobacter apostichopi TaxID=3035454 RepID=UPI002572B84A|nr:hypothetical protein [Marinobacter sp. LA51]